MTASMRGLAQVPWGSQGQSLALEGLKVNAKPRPSRLGGTGSRSRDDARDASTASSSRDATLDSLIVPRNIGRKGALPKGGLGVSGFRMVQSCLTRQCPMWRHEQRCMHEQLS
jgi:hypothetical protein